MKRKDWADQAASRHRYALKDGVAMLSLLAIARALRAAEKRGFKRAVKPAVWSKCCDLWDRGHRGGCPGKKP